MFGANKKPLDPNAVEGEGDQGLSKRTRRHAHKDKALVPFVQAQVFGDIPFDGQDGLDTERKYVSESEGNLRGAYDLRYKIQKLLRCPETKRGPAVCGCGYIGRGLGGAEGRSVALSRLTDGRKIVEGALRCDSAWLCPVCSVGRAMRAKDRVLEVASAAVDRGVVCLFVTLTVRHGRDDGLRTLKEGVSKAYRAALQGRWAQEFKRRSGYVGSTKSMEVRYSLGTGWHPHIHGLFFFRCDPSVASDYALEFVGRYIEQLQKLGLSATLGGQDVRAIYDADGVSKYATKAAMEMTGHWSKKYDGTRNKSFHPFELALYGSDRSLVNELPTALLLERFKEYSEVMPGTSLCQVSKTLREEFGISDDDQDESGVEVADESSVSDIAQTLEVAQYFWDRLNSFGVSGSFVYDAFNLDIEALWSKYAGITRTLEEVDLCLRVVDRADWANCSFGLPEPPLIQTVAGPVLPQNFGRSRLCPEGQVFQTRAQCGLD